MRARNASIDWRGAPLGPWVFTQKFQRHGPKCKEQTGRYTYFQLPLKQRVHQSDRREVVEVLLGGLGFVGFPALVRKAHQADCVCWQFSVQVVLDCGRSSQVLKAVLNPDMHDARAFAPRP